MMSNSSLATYTLISPNRTSPRQHRISGVAIHCTAGSADSTARDIANVFRSSARGASCNYAVGGDGSIALVVPEADRAWCTSNAIDHWIISIEVASDTTGITVRQRAIDALIKLLADICQRNGIDALRWSANKADAYNWSANNMVVHRWYANKSCPGDTLYSMHGEIARRVNALLHQEEADEMNEAQIQAMIERYGRTAIEEAAAEMAARQESDWARDALTWAMANGITDGAHPGSYCTREQIATMLYRFWHLMEASR